MKNETQNETEREVGEIGLEEIIDFMKTNGGCVNDSIRPVYRKGLRAICREIQEREEDIRAHWPSGLQDYRLFRSRVNVKMCDRAISIAEKVGLYWFAADAATIQGDLKKATELYKKAYDSDFKSDYSREKEGKLRNALRNLLESGMRGEAFDLAEKCKDLDYTWMNEAVRISRDLGLVDKTLSLMEERAEGGVYGVDVAEYAEENGRYGLSTEYYLREAGKIERKIRSNMVGDFSFNKNKFPLPNITPADYDTWGCNVREWCIEPAQQRRREDCVELKNTLENAVRTAKMANETDLANQIHFYMDSIGINRFDYGK